MKTLNMSARLLVPALGLILWWLLSANSSSPYFPPLSDVLAGFAETWTADRLVTDLLPSLTALLVGFGIAVITGVALGVVLSLFNRAERDIRPLTEFFRALPVAALVPVALVVLGPGTGMEIALISFASVWPILVATTDGLRSVDPLVLDMGRVYGVSRLQRVFTLLLPAALPRILAGVRIAIAIAVATMVVANMLGSSAGLGYFVVSSQQSFDIMATWAGLIMIGIVGSVVTLLLTLAQYRVLAWHRGWRSAGDTA